VIDFLRKTGHEAWAKMDDEYEWHRKLDSEWQEWKKKFGRLGRDSAIDKFVSSFRGGMDCYTVKVHGGSFNFSAQIRFDDGEQWIIRFPRPGSHMYPDEAVLCEVATMKFMQEKTSVPIARVIGYGTSKDNPLGLGPFIIMEFIDGTPLDEVMKNTNEAELKAIYRQIAHILLDLSSLNGHRIGSLTLDNNGSPCLSNRPLSRNLNELFRLSNICVDMPKEKTFGSSMEYAVELCNHHFAELRSRHNDDDGRGDAARRLIRNAIPRFIQDGDRFTLVCDDFRPGNMVWKDGRISGLFDLEFSYFAPPIFNCVTLDWLVLQDPRQDSPELDLTKFFWFLSELEQAESERGLQSDLSSSIKGSLDDNTFWYIRALKSTFRIDYICQEKLREISAMDKDAVDREDVCHKEQPERSCGRVQDAPSPSSPGTSSLISSISIETVLGFLIGTAILSVYFWRRR
jgi:aminoglycoside phosphotransferase (APT) family kinase protein